MGYFYSNHHKHSLPLFFVAFLQYCEKTLGHKRTSDTILSDAMYPCCIPSHTVFDLNIISLIRRFFNYDLNLFFVVVVVVPDRVSL